MRSKAELLTLLALAVVLSGCSFCRTLFGIQPTTPRPVVRARPVPTPRTLPESSLLSIYNAAGAHEKVFLANGNRQSAEQALDLFTRYLELSPAGTYSSQALLRKARLHCALDEATQGIADLRRLSRHPGATNEDAHQAKYVFGFCKGEVDIYGNPR